MSEGLQAPTWKLEQRANNPCGLAVGLESLTGKILFLPRGEDFGREFSVPIVVAAAAPELLEACKYLRRFVHSADVDTAFVDAAIAKAEGR